MYYTKDITNKEEKIFARLASKTNDSNLTCKHASCLVLGGKIIQGTICANHDRTKLGHCIFGSCHAEMGSIYNFEKLKRCKKCVLWV